MSEDEKKQLMEDVKISKKVILEPTEVAVLITIFVVLIGTIGVALFLAGRSAKEDYKITIDEKNKSVLNYKN